MTKFEKKIKLLFDAHDFFREPLMDAIIDKENALSIADDELEQLFAAGEPFAAGEKKDGRGGDKK